MADIVSIRHNDELLALIIPAAYRADGIQFFTPGTFFPAAWIYESSAGA